MDAMQGIAQQSLAGRTQGQAAIAGENAVAAAQRKDDPAIRKAAEDFEAVFIASILENMTATMPVNSTFGGGFSEQIYRGLLNEQYSKSIAAKGGIGIADNVYRFLMGFQEVGHDAPARSPR